MKQILIAGAALLTLTACGAGGASDRDAIVASCSAEESAEACECMADAMQEKLSPALFEKVAEAARANDETPADMLATLPLNQQQEFVKVLPQLMSCAASAAGN